MARRNANIYTTLRSLKKPTALDRVTESVPKPKGAVPNFGLPRWKFMPLQSKIPLIPGPKSAYYFSRNKIGRKLYTSSKDAEFDLNDPYNREIQFKYEPLHDRHLSRYFSNQRAIEPMIKLGLITENLDAKCSIKDYNMYRKYLSKLHSDSIKRELSRMAEVSIEQRELDVAEAAAQREADKLRKQEVTNRGPNGKKRQMEERQLRQAIKAEQAENRLKMWELRKREDRERRILRAKIRDEHRKRRRRLAAERERQKIIGILLKWVRKERDRVKKQRERARTIEEAKREELERKWLQRVKHQELQLTIQNFILDYAAEESKRNIQKYTAKVERERKKMKRGIKNKSKFLKCFNTRHSPGGQKTCCKIEKLVSKKSIDSITDKLEIYTDECEMTDRCKCDTESEYCMDLRQLPVLSRHRVQSIHSVH